MSDNQISAKSRLVGGGKLPDGQIGRRGAEAAEITAAAAEAAPPAAQPPSVVIPALLFLSACAIGGGGATLLGLPQMLLP